MPTALAQQPTGEGPARIAARLTSSTALAYGKPQPLVAGMQIEADVMQDRRRLIEWVFEPLFSLRGKV